MNELEMTALNEILALLKEVLKKLDRIEKSLPSND